MNKKVNCVCGSIICETSLRSHLKTKKHQNLYAFKKFPTLKSIDDKMNALYNNSNNMPENDYILQSNLLMNEYIYWKSELVHLKVWRYLGKTSNDKEIKIAYYDHRGKEKIDCLPFVYM